MIYLVLFEVESLPGEPVLQELLVEYDSTFEDVEDEPQAEAQWHPVRVAPLT